MNNNHNDDDDDDDDSVTSSDEVPLEADFEMSPLEQFVWRLRLNIVTRCTLPADFLDHEEEAVVHSFPYQLAFGLVQNVSLKRFGMELERSLTEDGANALADGIRLSSMESITLTTTRTTMSLLDDSPEANRITKAMRIVLVAAVKYVRKVSFDGCIFTDDAVHLQRAMKTAGKHPVLQNLSLKLFGAVTVKGATTLAQGICNSQISTLRIDSFPCDSFPCVLRLFLENGIAHAPRMRQLCLNGGWHPNVQDPQLIKHASISIVKGLANEFEGEIGILVWPIRFVERLELEHCHLTKAEISLWGQTLGSIKTLELTCNGMDEEVVRVFVANWQPESPLEEMILAENGIGASGICELLRATATHPTFQKLQVKRNQQNIRFQGLVAMAEALAESKMLVLVLPSVQAEPVVGRHAIKSQKAARHAAGQALLAAVESNYVLQHLDLSSIDIEQAVKNEIQLYVELNKKGRHCVLEHDLTPSLWGHVLANKCNNNNNNNNVSMMYYYLREFPLFSPSAPKSANASAPITNAAALPINRKSRKAAAAKGKKKGKRGNRK